MVSVRTNPVNKACTTAINPRYSATALHLARASRVWNEPSLYAIVSMAKNPKTTLVVLTKAKLTPRLKRWSTTKSQCPESRNACLKSSCFLKTNLCGRIRWRGFSVFATSLEPLAKADKLSIGDSLSFILTHCAGLCQQSCTKVGCKGKG